MKDIRPDMSRRLIGTIEQSVANCHSGRSEVLRLLRAALW